MVVQKGSPFSPLLLTGLWKLDSAYVASIWSMVFC